MDRRPIDPARRSSRHRTATKGLLLITILLGAALPGRASAGDDLAQRYACVACHQPEADTVGPSWKAIAARHEDASPEQLAAAIEAGSQGRWGPVPMPQKPQVPEADLRALAEWILSQP